MLFHKRVLLLGQESHATRLVRQALENAGQFVLKEERNSSAALEMARLFQPEILFVAVGENELEWNEVLRQLKTDAAFRAIPIFMLIVSSAGDSVVYNGSLDGYEFSIDPVKIEEVVRSVIEILRTEQPLGTSA